jgi:hypothetical protein
MASQGPARYGVYDLSTNAGWVSVGCDHDTAAFAVQTIRRWWFACLVRQHWSIENGRHLVLDTTMTEDASRIRRNPGVFACLRQFALNLLRGNGEHNISRALYRNALSLDRLLNYAGIREK